MKVRRPLPFSEGRPPASGISEIGSDHASMKLSAVLAIPWDPVRTSALRNMYTRIGMTGQSVHLATQNNANKRQRGRRSAHNMDYDKLRGLGVGGWGIDGRGRGERSSFPPRTLPG